MRPRVVITGMGIRSPIGNCLDEFARNLSEGITGIRESTEVFPGQTVCAGLVRDYDPLEHFSPGEVSRLDRTAQFAILAARQALADAGLRIGDMDGPARREVGLALGTSHGGRSQLDRFIDEGSNEDEEGMARRLLVLAPHYQQTAAVAHALGLRGPVVTLSNACSSSGGALGHAFELLVAGKVKVMVAGGADGFAKLTYAGFGALGAMADGPTGPFSSKIGLSLGDGAAFVVLETLEHAEARGARIHADLLGYGLSWDAYHITAPEPSGEGIFRAIAMAARTAGVALQEVNYVNAHGTGTRSNDVAECLALKRFFQDREAVPPVSATKSFTGHTLGASAAMGLITSVVAMERGIIPPTLNFAAPARGATSTSYPIILAPARSGASCPSRRPSAGRTPCSSAGGPARGAPRPVGGPIGWSSPAWDSSRRSVTASRASPRGCGRGGAGSGRSSGSMCRGAAAAARA